MGAFESCESHGELKNALAQFGGSYDGFQWRTPKKRHFLKFGILTENVDFRVGGGWSRLFGVCAEFMDPTQGVGVVV